MHVERTGARRGRTPNVPRDPTLVVIAIAVDLGFILLALALADQVAPTTWLGPTLQVHTAIAHGAVVLLWLVALSLHGAHDMVAIGGGPGEFRAVILGCVSASAAVTATSYVLDTGVPTSALVATFLIGLVLLLVGRALLGVALRALRSRGLLTHGVLIVGHPTEVSDLVESLKRHEHANGLRVVGTCLASDGHKGPDPPGGREEPEPSLVDTAGDVVRACEDARADSVLLAGSWTSAQGMRRLSWMLADEGIDLFVSADMTEVGARRVQLAPTAGLPLIAVGKPRIGAAGGVAKRLLDIVVSLAAIVLLAPVVLAVVILIKLEDRGPVYFRQVRIGRRGRPFTMLKFRSMEVDADRLEASMREEQGHQGPLWKMETDPRTTKVGNFLRRTSLDELPQLFNVLLGQMSLVGPRPQQAWEVETYGSDMRRRLLVRPGLTGLWQVSGRSDLSLDEAVRLDLYYVDNWSMLGDLAILAKTVKAVLTTRGAS